MNCDRLISCIFCAELAFFTTCHKATAANRITTQKMIVLTVEFTKKLLEQQPAYVPIAPSRRPGGTGGGTTPIKLDACSGFWIDKMPLTHSTLLGSKNRQNLEIT